MTVDTPNSNPPVRDPKRADHYASLVQLVVHGQENKWWMFYIFLMYNSILLLTCSSLLTAQQYSLGLQFLLTLLSVGGIFMAVCWIVMGMDYVDASNSYSDAAVAAEENLPDGHPKPMTNRKSQRERKSYIGTSEMLAKAIPLVFIAFYLCLLTLTWLRPASLDANANPSRGYHHHRMSH